MNYKLQSTKTFECSQHSRLQKRMVLTQELSRIISIVTRTDPGYCGEYPDDVIECCINLCEWEVKNRGKVGIKAETLSRHSVTYFDQDASNQMNGYPVSLLGCLKPYRKARC